MSEKQEKLQPGQARVIEVIETMQSSKEGGTFRWVTLYWSRDGQLLAIRDPLRDAEAQLAGESEQVKSAADPAPDAPKDAP